MEAFLVINNASKRPISRFSEIFRNFEQPAVYPLRMAPIGARLGQNTFQTIPKISIFDVENEKNKQFFFWQTLTGHLPLQDGSIRPQTLGNPVSDDPRHFIFQCGKNLFNENVRR